MINMLDKAKTKRNNAICEDSLLRKPQNFTYIGYDMYKKFHIIILFCQRQYSINNLFSSEFICKNNG